MPRSSCFACTLGHLRAGLLFPSMAFSVAARAALLGGLSDYLSQLVRFPSQLAYHPFNFARRPFPPMLPPAAAETVRSPLTLFSLSAAAAGPAMSRLLIHCCQMTSRCLLGAQRYRHVERVIICTQNNVSGRALLSQVPHTNE